MAFVFFFLRICYSMHACNVVMYVCMGECMDEMMKCKVTYITIYNAMLCNAFFFCVCEVMLCYVM